MLVNYCIALGTPGSLFGCSLLLTSIDVAHELCGLAFIAQSVVSRRRRPVAERLALGGRARDRRSLIARARRRRADQDATARWRTAVRALFLQGRAARRLALRMHIRSQDTVHTQPSHRALAYRSYRRRGPRHVGG